MVKKKSNEEIASEFIAVGIVGAIILIFAAFSIFGSSTEKNQTNQTTTIQKKAPSTYSPQLEDYDRNQISSTILAVSCGGKEGLIPRSKMGANIKKMLDEKGYDSTKVYNNWDYYWRRAKEMDRVNGTNCLG